MIVVISPHLDDAVFSVGGQMAARSEEDWHVMTIFTLSVPDPTGFALTCQMDKGISPEVDYMALRREEDKLALWRARAGIEHWHLPEAPHRGYDSAEALFGGILPGDTEVSKHLREFLPPVLRHLAPQEIWYPYGMGGHVDHLQVNAAVEAVRTSLPGVRFVRYLEQPYTNKIGRLPEENSLREIVLDRESAELKFVMARDYASQVGFQFGGKKRVARVLGDREWMVD